MAVEMIGAWQNHGFFQIKLTEAQLRTLERAYSVSRSFFERKDKAQFVNDRSFSGYVGLFQEITKNKRDHSEVFTITKDFPPHDDHVQNNWPCHGPCPWPDKTFQVTMNDTMAMFFEVGEKLLRLIELGIGLKESALAKLTENGWHHMRNLRYPGTNDSAETGVGEHTDYGLLVIVSQDEVGGLCIKSPEGAPKKNDEEWTYVPPAKDTLTVFPGKILLLALPISNPNGTHILFA
ncbi:hypothetical protein GP486_001659 [Trichoglossum hirsutum]|uniref:Uncharacterized protein n=1 Tax=Trichoglossum hirsutum TaxID=265104 RepID=A0A9P8LG98_9PEZI|nr:hypothetical protein GP486_001659 [Trichoglossum hirsutum]